MANQSPERFESFGEPFREGKGRGGRGETAAGPPGTGQGEGQDRTGTVT